MVETSDAVSDGFHVMMSRICCHDSGTSLIAGQREQSALAATGSAGSGEAEDMNTRCG